MHPPTVLPLALLFLTTAALPLNINLGAYSPALVVGDGAISFEGAEGGEGGEGGEAGAASATQIVNALQGAAINGASSSAAAATKGNSNAAGVTPPGVQAASVAGDVDATPILNDPTASLPTPGSAKALDPRP